MLPQLLHPCPHYTRFSLPYGSYYRIHLAKTSPPLTMRRRRGGWRSGRGSTTRAATSEESVASVSTDDDKVYFGLATFGQGICCGPRRVVFSVFFRLETATL